VLYLRCETGRAVYSKTPPDHSISIVALSKSCCFPPLESRPSARLPSTATDFLAPQWQTASTVLLRIFALPVRILFTAEIAEIAE
jgi:hypothetical protein